MGLLSEVVKSGIEMVPPRIVLYGEHGIGKSSWAASAKKCKLNPIILPTEDGVKTIDCDKLPVAKTYDMVNDYLKALLTEAHTYKMLIIDTADWLEQLIQLHICQNNGYNSIEDFGFGTGYKKSAEEWMNLFDTLEKLHREKKMVICLLAHAGIRRVEEPGFEAYDAYAPKLHTNSKGVGIANTLQEWADAVLFCKKQAYIKAEDAGFNRSRNVVTGIGERTIYTEEQAGFKAKNRYGLPAEIKMGADGESDFGIFWKALKSCPVFAKKKKEPVPEVVEEINDQKEEAEVSAQ